MKSKIDWANHIVAFVSTLLGIFVAFQLDGWQEDRKQRRELDNAMTAIEKEVRANVRIYKTNVERLGEFVSYKQFLDSHSMQDGSIRATEREMRKLVADHSNRIQAFELIRKVNDSINQYQELPLRFDVIPVTGISTVNWKAATSLGTLSEIDHERLTLLTQLYDWFERDMGMSESDFFMNAIGVDQFDDATAIAKKYVLIVEISKFKLARISEPLEKLGWD